MVIVCYDVDNLVLYQLGLKDISQLVQTSKYWQRRMGWFMADYKEIKNLNWYRRIPFSERKRLKSDGMPGTAEHYFTGACCIGSIKMAKWIWNITNGTIDYQYMNNAPFRLLQCSKHLKNKLEIAKWLWNISRENINIHADDEWAFRMACAREDIEMLKWLWEVSKQSINIGIKYLNPFVISCGKGNLEIVKWLWKISHKRWDINIDGAFSNSCLGGNLEIIKWIMNKRTKPIKYRSFVNAFITSCTRGNLNVARLLHEKAKGVIDIHERNDLAFRCSCTYGYLNVAKWLWEISGGVFNFADKTIPFYWAIEYGRIEIVKWLWEVNNDNIHIHSIIQESIFHNKNEIAEWMCAQKPQYWPIYYACNMWKKLQDALPRIIIRCY